MRINNHLPSEIRIALAFGRQGQGSVEDGSLCWESMGWYTLDGFQRLDVDVPGDTQEVYLHIVEHHHRDYQWRVSHGLSTTYRPSVFSGQLKGSVKNLRVGTEASFHFQEAHQISNGWFLKHPHREFIPVDSRQVAVFFPEWQFDSELSRLKLSALELGRLNPIVDEVILRPTWWQRLNPFFWWAQRRYRPIRKVLEEVERYSALIRDVETACELQKVGHAVPLNKPFLYRSLHGIREKLVRAVKTDRVLRKNPNYADPAKARAVGPLQLQPRHAQEYNAATAEHASLYNEAMELSMRVGAELERFGEY